MIFCARKESERRVFALIDEKITKYDSIRSMFYFGNRLECPEIVDDPFNRPMHRSIFFDVRHGFGK